MEIGTNCNITMPNVLPPQINNGKICNTCNKEDVCMYKDELEQAVEKITKISEGENLFIDVNIKCKKWSGKTSNLNITYRTK